VLPELSGNAPNNRFFYSGVHRFFALVAGQFALFWNTLSDMPAASGSALIDAHLGVGMDAAGRIVLTRGNVVIATSAAAHILNNTFHRIEVAIYVHQTAGTFTCRVDGVEAVTFTGDTQPDLMAAPSIGVISWRAPTTGTSMVLDDWAAWKEQGVAPNDFIGDFRIDTLYPNGNGATVTGTGVGTGVTLAWHAVDEANMHNGDTDYVTNLTNGNEDLFTFTDLGSIPTTVHGVGIVLTNRAEAAGLRRVQASVRSGGVTAPSGTDLPVYGQASYRSTQQFFSLDPSTGVAFTGGAIQSLEAGYRLTA
jgi:hypothetical protein